MPPPSHPPTPPQIRACRNPVVLPFNHPPTHPPTQAFAPPKAAAPAPAAAGFLKEKNDFSFRLQSVAGGAAAPAKKNALVEKLWNEDTKLAAYISIWYLGNIWYNIYNKKVRR